MRDGLHAVVATVQGIPMVLDYEPAAVNVRCLTWILLDSYERTQFGQLTAMRYRFMVRVATPFQDNKGAEDEVVQTALYIADAVDADPQFSGVLVSGIAESPQGQTGWIQIGGVAGTKCRVVDVFVSVLEKTAYAGALP